MNAYRRSFRNLSANFGRAATLRTTCAYQSTAIMAATTATNNRQGGSAKFNWLLLPFAGFVGKLLMATVTCSNIKSRAEKLCCHTNNWFHLCFEWYLLNRAWHMWFHHLTTVTERRLPSACWFNAALLHSPIQSHIIWKMSSKILLHVSKTKQSVSTIHLNSLLTWVICSSIL